MRMLRNIEGAPSGGTGSGCEDARCGCGNLLARVVGGDVELKCRRCKRVWRLALTGPGAGEGDGATAPRARAWRLEEGSR